MPLPIFYVVGAAAVTGATTAYAWLSRDEWSTEQYNEQMSTMFQTLKLWDELGWMTPGRDKGACWYRNQNKRAEWKLFIKRFGKFYGEHGKQSFYLPDSVEKVARDYVRDLAAWGEWLEASCGIGRVKPKPEEDAEAGIKDALKWGAIIVGGIVALQIVSSVRDMTRRRY